MIAQERKTQGKKSDQENAEQDMPRFFEGFRREKSGLNVNPSEDTCSKMRMVLRMQRTG